MACQRANPTPFLPPGFNRVTIQGRDVMVHSMLSRPLARHEDYAIVSLDPMPDNQVPFPIIRNTIRAFLDNHMEVRVACIQPSTLGQALVKFEYLFDRDRLVFNSPHHFNGTQFTFVKHNEGRNYRAVEFNRECWLMLMGFPLDYWNNASVQSANCFFGRVLAWEDDQNHLARLIVRAQVLDLERVPQFIVVTDAEGFHGHSWIVQCEVIEQQLLGALPADEEPVPDNMDDLHPIFDFFGFGQEAQPQPELAIQEEEQNNVQNNDQGQDAMAWGIWPQEPA